MNYSNSPKSNRLLILNCNIRPFLKLANRMFQEAIKSNDVLAHLYPSHSIQIFSESEFWLSNLIGRHMVFFHFHKSSREFYWMGLWNTI
jgi:hypothetical protein